MTVPVEPDAPPPPTYRHLLRPTFPTWPQAVVLCAVLLLTIWCLKAVALMLLQVSPNAHRVDPTEALPVALLAPLHILSYLFTLSVAVMWSRVPLRNFAPLHRIPIKLFCPMLVMLAGATIVISEVNNALQYFRPVSDPFAHTVSGLIANPMIGIVTLVVVAPATEELLFRGVILRGFLRNYSTAGAIILSSILFGVIHTNLWQFPGAFFLGAMFAWWRTRVGSLMPGLLGHGLYNTLPLIAVYLLGAQMQDYSEPSQAVEFQPLWFDALGIALLTAGCLWLRRMFNFYYPPPKPAGLPEIPSSFDKSDPGH